MKVPYDLGSLLLLLVSNNKFIVINMDILNQYWTDKENRLAIGYENCYPQAGLAFVLLKNTTPTQEEYDDMMNKIQLMRPWFLLKRTRYDLLQRTDIVMIKDFPISEEDLNLWIIYRQALRDLPITLHNQGVELTDENYLSFLPTPPFDIDSFGMNY